MEKNLSDFAQPSISQTHWITVFFFKLWGNTHVHCRGVSPTRGWWFQNSLCLCLPSGSGLTAADTVWAPPAKLDPNSSKVRCQPEGGGECRPRRGRGISNCPAPLPGLAKWAADRLPGNSPHRLGSACSAPRTAAPSPLPPQASEPGQGFRKEAGEKGTHLFYVSSACGMYPNCTSRTTTYLVPAPNT